MGEEFRFLYKYKRGDTCNYCGTVFGYDVESEVGARDDNVKYVLASALLHPFFILGLARSNEKYALESARKKAKEETLFRPCPRCGRLPSEAYATEFSLYWIGVVAFGPIMIGAAVVLVGIWGELWRTVGDALTACAIAAFGSAVWCSYRSLCAHRVFFRAPAKNLEAPKKKTKNGKARDVAGPVARIRLGMSGWEAVIPEIPKILGTRPECATRREMKGRRLFWLLSAVRIAAPWTFALIPLGYAGIRLELFDGDAVKDAAIALGISAFLTWAVVNWKIRYQGERQFGCGWDRASLQAELAKKQKKKLKWDDLYDIEEELRQIELNESARAVKILRATTDLTPEGARFLKIAEKEAKELEALRKMEEMLRQKEKEKNGEGAKPAPNANVAGKKATKKAGKKAGKKATEKAGEAKKDDVATTRKDAELAASAKRLNKYDC